MRDDFSAEVIRICKMQAAFICSRPECRRLTIAPSINDEMSIQYNGKVAHISAAAAAGPRYNEQMTSEQRKSITNAIFLCSSCADLIDKNNGLDYSVDILKSWKNMHLRWVLENLNQPQIADSQLAIENYFQYGGISAQIVNVNGSISHVIDEKKQHDILKFKAADNMFNEDQFFSLYYDLSERGKCNLSDLQKLNISCSYYRKIGNTFLNPVIEKSKNKFIKSFSELLAYIVFHFDGLDNEDETNNVTLTLNADNKEIIEESHLRLFPDAFKWNNRNYPRLEKLAASLKEAYSRYRRIVKQELHI
jgi:hypothetical protein